jgi:hypothetical protein
MSCEGVNVAFLNLRRGRSGGSTAYALVDFRSPCRLHRAVHPVGVTCTTIRRAQSGQYRGGSSSRRAAHRG